VYNRSLLPATGWYLFDNKPEVPTRMSVTQFTFTDSGRLRCRQFPSTSHGTKPGIHVGSINKDFQNPSRVRLVGGVQALLEADLPEGTAVDATAMEHAVRIVDIVSMD